VLKRRHRGDPEMCASFRRARPYVFSLTSNFDSDRQPQVHEPRRAHRDRSPMPWLEKQGTIVHSPCCVSPISARRRARLSNSTTKPPSSKPTRSSERAVATTPSNFPGGGMNRTRYVSPAPSVRVPIRCLFQAVRWPQGRTASNISLCTNSLRPLRLALLDVTPHHL
jgi:hypothetical protein